MILKELRVVLQRLSKERIKEIRKSYGTEKIKDLESLMSSGQKGDVTLLPKKIGKLHHCPELECKYSSTSRWSVVQHIRTHTGEKPYVCNFVNCGQAFVQKSHLTIHSNIHNLSPFRCRVCPSRFYTLEQLGFHVNVKHSKFKCKFCGKLYSNSYSFNTQFTLVDHFNVLTGQKPHVCSFVNCVQKNVQKLHPFQCTICKSRFPTEYNLNSHVKVKHLSAKREFKCKLCGSDYSSARSLKYHLTTHTGEKHIACRICCERFRLHKQLKKHVDTVHFDKEKQKNKNYKCSICDRSYSHKYSLVTHMAIKHGENPKKFNCAFCDKSFLESSALVTHSRTHTGEKPFVCKLCPFKTSQNSNLNTHIKRIHTKHKPHNCVVCSKRFTVKYDLNIHSRVHTGEKLYTCSECQMSFRHKSSLKSHMRTHTGEKPYTCTFCNKNFRQSSTLGLHTRTHTKETVRRFECNECESKFMKSCHLREHMMIHTGEKPFTCKFCAKTFRSQNYFRVHEKSHTESFDCDECDRKYSFKSSLDTHKQRDHFRNVNFVEGNLTIKIV